MSVDPSQKKRFLGQTILSFLLSEKGYANFQWRTKLRNALPTQNATPVSVLPTCDEYREWMRRPHAPVPHQNDERPGLATSARILLHPLHCSHPECLPAATRAGVRGFIGGYSTMVLVHVVLPAVIYRNMSLRTFLCNLTHSSPSLSFAVFVSAFSFLYKILLRSLTLHPITSYNPLLPPFTAALLASPTLLLDTASPYRRISIALYIATKTSQFVYQAAQEKGLVPSMPFWCGRWLLFAVSSAQMIWCFLNDPESFPPSYNKFIVTRSSTYVPRRPKGWTGATWPTGAEIVQGIRVISDAGFPAFDREKALQMGGPMDNLRPVIESADDGHKHLLCALLHPDHPNCWHPFLSLIRKEWPRNAKFISIFILIGIAVRGRVAWKKPSQTILRAVTATAGSATFITMSVSTSWACLCAFQHILPEWFMATQNRIALNGFVGALWVLLETRGRQLDIGLYSLRMAIESAWRGMEKRGIVRGCKGGEAIYFGISMGCLMALMTTQKSAVSSRYVWALVNGLLED